MMTKEYMKNAAQTIEDALKIERPHDTIRVRYGLPEKPYVIHASLPMRQTTLDEFMELDSEPTLALPKKLYELDITVRSSLLRPAVIAHTIFEISQALSRLYPCGE